MATQAVDLSIVAPMYNEAENVASTVERLEACMRDFEGEWEFLMVNDGSTDNTLEVAEQIAAEKERVRVVSYPRNAGRGKALRTGFDNARGRIVVTVDFDLSYHESHILRMYNTLRDNPDVDVVLTSAYMPGGKTVGVPLSRLLPSKLGNKLLRLALPKKIWTSTCVVRAYRRHVLDSLELESDGKEIHLETLSKILALGYKVQEIPGTLESRRKGQSKAKLRATSISHLLFSFAERPMLVFGFFGLLLLALGFATGFYLIIKWQQGDLTVGRPLFTLLVLLVLGGAQILSFGFLAMQIASLRRELYVIQRENRNLEQQLRSEDEAGTS